MIANLSASVWARAITARIPRAVPNCFVDDTTDRAIMVAEVYFRCHFIKPAETAWACSTNLVEKGISPSKSIPAFTISMGTPR